MIMASELKISALGNFSQGEEICAARARWPSAPKMPSNGRLRGGPANRMLVPPAVDVVCSKMTSSDRV